MKEQDIITNQPVNMQSADLSQYAVNNEYDNYINPNSVLSRMLDNAIKTIDEAIKENNYYNPGTGNIVPEERGIMQDLKDKADILTEIAEAQNAEPATSASHESNPLDTDDKPVLNSEQVTSENINSDSRTDNNDADKSNKEQKDENRDGADNNQAPDNDIMQNETPNTDEPLFEEKVPEVNLDDIFEEPRNITKKTNNKSINKSCKKAKSNKKTKKHKKDTDRKSFLSIMAKGLWKGIKFVISAVFITATIPIWIIPAAARRLWDRITGRDLYSYPNQPQEKKETSQPAPTPIIQIDSSNQAPIREMYPTEPENGLYQGNNDTPSYELHKQSDRSNVNTSLKNSTQAKSSWTEEELNEEINRLFTKAAKENEPQTVTMPDKSSLKFINKGSKEKGNRYIAVIHESAKTGSRIIYEKRQVGIDKPEIKHGKYGDVKAMLKLCQKPEKKPEINTFAPVKRIEKDPVVCENIIKESIAAVEKTREPVILELADKTSIKIHPDKTGGFGIFLKDISGDYSHLYGMAADGPDNAIIPHGEYKNVINAIKPGIVIYETNEKTKQKPVQETAPIKPAEKNKTNALNDAYNSALLFGEKTTLELENGDSIVFTPVKAIADDGIETRVDVYVVDKTNAVTMTLLKNIIKRDEKTRFFAGVEGSMENVEKLYYGKDKEIPLDELLMASKKEETKKSAKLQEQEHEDR